MAEQIAILVASGYAVALKMLSDCVIVSGDINFLYLLSLLGIYLMKKYITEHSDIKYANIFFFSNTKLSVHVLNLKPL